MGGEITWECIKDGVDEGKYFTAKVYEIMVELLSATTQLLMFGIIKQLLKNYTKFYFKCDISPNGNAQNSGNSCLDCVLVLEFGRRNRHQSAPVNFQRFHISRVGGYLGFVFENGAITNLVLSSTTSPSEGFTLGLNNVSIC